MSQAAIPGIQTGETADLDQSAGEEVVKSGKVQDLLEFTVLADDWTWNDRKQGIEDNYVVVSLMAVSVMRCC